MPKLRFTTDSIKRLKPPTDKAKVQYFDSELTGFMIEVKNKREGTRIKESGIFFATRTLNGISDISKKVRMPKNRTAQKIKNKENADFKNHNNAIAAARVALNPLWEAWCKYDSQVSFSKFEREIMKFRAYKKRLNIVKSKMNTPA